MQHPAVGLTLASVRGCCWLKPLTLAYALDPRLHMRVQVLPLAAGPALRAARRVLPLHSPALAAAHMGASEWRPSSAMPSLDQSQAHAQ